MDKLREFILQLGVVGPEQVSDAQFNFPQSGLIEALAYELGPEKERVIVSSISESLGIFALEPHEIVIEDEISRFEIDPLVTKYKAVPLRFEEKTFRLVMANPFDSEAVEAFEEVFSCKAILSLAPESAIISAWSKCKAQFTLTPTRRLAKVQLAEHEDPEALKAVQQVIATAVKHAANRVEIDLTLGFTRAIFKLGDDKSTPVDISVSPKLFASSLFASSLLSKRSANNFSGIAQVQFKALRAECEFSHLRILSKEKAEMLHLGNFTIDSQENRLFWQSLSPGPLAALQEICEPEMGVTFVVGGDEKSRFHALAALRDYFDESETLDLPVEEALKANVFAKGDSRRVFVGVNSGDVFELLKACVDLPRQSKENLRGIFAYQQLSQNCWCCEKVDKVEDNALSCIPSFIDLTRAQFRKGNGCDLCSEQGTLGWLGVGSVANLRGRVGAGFVAGAGFEGLLSELITNGFKTLFEDAVCRAAAGGVQLTEVIESVPRPPSRFEASFWKRGEANGATSLEVIVDEGVLPNGKADLSKPEEPLRGKDAFYGKRESTVAPQKDSPQVNGDSQHLLIIDDDPDQREILQRVLELEGYRVSVAADGVDGLVSANRERPDLIIVDFMMPDLDGRETVIRLKQNNDLDEVPIVVLTAYPDSEIEFSLLEAGADDFLSKATAKKVLLKRISRLL